MKSFREQVLDMIQAKPGIRDDMIAQALDCGLDEVYPAIRVDILERKVTAENADAKHRTYRMNDSYLGWQAPPAPANEAPRTAKGKMAQAVPSMTPGIVNSCAIGELKIIEWDTGSLVISANNKTVDLSPAQVKALRAFVELTE